LERSARRGVSRLRPWSVFATIAPFDLALAKRYGPPKSIEDYVAKSQLENYDNVRAQFERSIANGCGQALDGPSSTGCSTTPGPRCIGICTIIS